jgi:hypothetical protein
MASVAGPKRLAVLRARIERAVANGAAAASSRIRVARLPVRARESAATSARSTPRERGRRVRDRQLTGNGLTVEWRGRGSSVGGAVLMAVDAALLDRAGELKREPVAFSQQPRFDRALSEVLA